MALLVLEVAELVVASARCTGYLAEETGLVGDRDRSRDILINIVTVDRPAETEVAEYQ